MTIEELRYRNLIVLECISGSRAYGLATPASDTDIKGVFILPKEDFYGLNYVDQVSNETNDIVFYELRRFMELVAKNNPNILELLNTPAEHILYKHPVMKHLEAKDVLSKLCKDTFGGYATAQIRKAKGLNKKIVNPVEKDRKGVLDFCYVVQGQGSIPVKQFLSQHEYRQEACGLSKIPHMHELYGLYHGNAGDYKGLIRKENANDIALSSISKGVKPIAVMSFNKSGYSKYCKEYKEYWDWVEKRNEDRYANTISHGKNYDAKNMMHTFRLLNMAAEIGREGVIHVHRNDREELLNIRSGEYEYDELVTKANKKIREIESIYEKSALPDKPNRDHLNALLVRMRSEYYRMRSRPSEST